MTGSLAARLIFVLPGSAAGDCEDCSAAAAGEIAKAADPARVEARKSRRETVMGFSSSSIGHHRLQRTGVRRPGVHEKSYITRLEGRGGMKKLNQGANIWLVLRSARNRSIAAIFPTRSRASSD